MFFYWTEISAADFHKFNANGQIFNLLSLPKICFKVGKSELATLLSRLPHLT